MFEEVVSDFGLGYGIMLCGQVDCMFSRVCVAVVLVISVVGLIGVFTVTCVVCVVVVAELVGVCVLFVVGGF